MGLEVAIAALKQYSDAADAEEGYGQYPDALPIPLPFEAALSRIWPGLEAASAADISVLVSAIDMTLAGHLTFDYSFRMASHALQVRSPDPAAWGLFALALASSQCDRYDVRRFLTPPCDALNRLGLAHRDFLIRAAKLAPADASVFLDYLDKPSYPGPIEDQDFELAETAAGPRYVLMTWDE